MGVGFLCSQRGIHLTRGDGGKLEGRRINMNGGKPTCFLIYIRSNIEATNTVVFNENGCYPWR